ncbi:hypothetical protein F5884DRAFT_792085 [Xylogone sp. PMI_703]|nr:hypothetical protein F5884DRAFT_792085 [Xylogone sp. PMI_703]
MKRTIASLFLLPLINRATAYSPSNFAPFLLPSDNEATLLSNDSLTPVELELLKRAGNCPNNYNPCIGNGAGSCCTAGSVCTVDNANNIACCRLGATCTGTIATPANSGGVSTGGFAGFGSRTSTASAPSNAIATVTGSLSLVQNSYFPWPYIPTSYANSAACNSAYQACQTNYMVCTNDLVGGGFAVTISVPGGGGTTIAPTATALPTPSATSICSSLYSEGCFNIQSSDCAQFGNGPAPSATNSDGFIAGTGGNAASSLSMGSISLKVIAAVMLGVAGQVVLGS